MYVIVRSEEKIMNKILDWNKYIEKAVDAVSEGIVMLKNNNNALPLKAEEVV